MVTLVGQGARIILQLVGVVVLARLLAPADFGLIAMAAAFIGLGELLRDFGLSSAAIQSKKLSTEQRDNLCWLNISLGLALCIATVVAAPAIATFFGDVALVPIIRWLSLVLLFGGASTQFRASLTREMKFGELAICDVIAPAAGLATGVVSALHGWNAYALVAQQVSGAAIGLIAVIVAARWLPSHPRLRANVRPFLKYGTDLFTSQVLVYSSKNVDTIVLGARFGAGAVGIYDRAFQLMMTPIMQLNAPFTRVALPTLSRLQDDPQNFSRYLLRAQKLLMYFMVTILAIGAAHAVPIVDIVLGSSWSASAPLLQILAIGGIFQMVGYSTMWIFLSKGLTREWLLFTIVARTLMIMLILGGSYLSVTGVAVGYSVGLAMQWPIGLWWVRKIPGVRSGVLFINGCKVIALLVMAATPSFVISTWWRPLSGGLNIATGMLSMVLVLSVALVIVPGLRADLGDVKDVLKRAVVK